MTSAISSVQDVTPQVADSITTDQVSSTTDQKMTSVLPVSTSSGLLGFGASQQQSPLGTSTDSSYGFRFDNLELVVTGMGRDKSGLDFDTKVTLDGQNNFSPQAISPSDFNLGTELSIKFDYGNVLKSTGIGFGKVSIGVSSQYYNKRNPSMDICLAKPSNDAYLGAGCLDVESTVSPYEEVAGETITKLTQSYISQEIFKSGASVDSDKLAVFGLTLALVGSYSRSTEIHLAPIQGKKVVVDLDGKFTRYAENGNFSDDGTIFTDSIGTALYFVPQIQDGQIRGSVHKLSGTLESRSDTEDGAGIDEADLLTVMATLDSGFRIGWMNDPAPYDSFERSIRHDFSNLPLRTHLSLVHSSYNYLGAPRYTDPETGSTIYLSTDEGAAEAVGGTGTESDITITQPAQNDSFTFLTAGADFDLMLPMRKPNEDLIVRARPCVTVSANGGYEFTTQMVTYGAALAVGLKFE